MVLNLMANRTGTATLELTWVNRPQQRGDWRSVPAFPVLGYTPQSDPSLGVVMATWHVQVVDFFVAYSVFPSAVLQLQNPDGSVQKDAKLTSDDVDRCTVASQPPQPVTVTD